MSSPKRAPEALIERFRSGRRFVLTSHVSPDGDAIGSEVGLARILEQMGKKVIIWNRDPVPGVYQSLPGTADIHVGETPPPGWPEVDFVVILECPSQDRTGLEEHWQGHSVLNLDHHLGNTGHGEVVWIDTDAPAVGEMVYRLAVAMGHSLDPTTANALYLTLVTDTGGFRYSNTTAETFDAAASLVRAGAAPEIVSRWLYESRPAAAVHLQAASLATLEMHAEGRIAAIRLTREMIDATGAEAGDSEGLIDYPRSIFGVEAAVLFREREDGGSKVSLRSKDSINVEKVARRFGGGGHHNAAGFSSDESLETLQRETLEALHAALEQA